MELNAWGRFLDGDDSAFTTVYNTYFQILYEYAMRLGFDKEKTEDAIHDVYFNLYISRSKLKHVENIQFYLLRSLRNRLLNVLKKDNKVYFDSFDGTNIVDGDSSALSRLIDDELIDRMKTDVGIMIKSLKPKQRKVIYYRYILNLKFTEIADILGEKPDTVKKTHHRALLQLKKDNRFSSTLYLLFILFELASI